jgi:protein tyrosine/serine phosphatase
MKLLKPRPSAWCAVLALALVLAGAGCRRGSLDPRYPDVPIRRFAEVDKGLFRGAQPDAEGFRALNGLGVRTVLNFRGEDEDTAFAPAGMNVVQLQAHINEPSDTEIKSFFDIALDPAKRPLFMHCAEGRERTGFYAALYRIEVDGWTTARALDEMRAFGFRDEDHPEVVEYVAAYKPRGYAPKAATAATR